MMQGRKSCARSLSYRALVKLEPKRHFMPMRIIGLAGWSGAGKTTLITKVIPVLTGRGLKVATVKHAHHEFDLDRPGKDSWRHREAGAS